MNDSKFFPGRELYLRVRAGFILQDTTVSAWCEVQGIPRQHALAVLTGQWNGPKAKRLRTRIIEASGIDKPPLAV
ncbi:MAG TPA: hypothetical protein PKZ35_13410 [Gammaproteobacteria bacterium]|nr:hypothetical protein [Gammaproteobacteria bacterium]